MALVEGAKRDERVLIAFVADLMALNALLLLADITPDFVQLDPAGAEANHHSVVQFSTAASDAPFLDDYRPPEGSIAPD
jgi:hypothetical protein